MEKSKNWAEKLYERIENWVMKHSLLLFFISMVLWVVHFYYYRNYLSLKQEVIGQIGDSIGGFFGPLIAFFSTLLVYKSFREQQTANDLLLKQINTEHGLLLVKEIDKLIKDLNQADEEYKIQLQTHHSMMNVTNIVIAFEKSLHIIEEDSRITEHLIMSSRYKEFLEWRNSYYAVTLEMLFFVKSIKQNELYSFVHPLLKVKLDRILSRLIAPIVQSEKLLREFRSYNNKHTNELDDGIISFRKLHQEVIDSIIQIY